MQKTACERELCLFMSVELTFLLSLPSAKHPMTSSGLATNRSVTPCAEGRGGEGGEKLKCLLVTGWAGCGLTLTKGTLKLSSWIVKFTFVTGWGWGGGEGVEEEVKGRGREEGRGEVEGRGGRSGGVS